MDSAATGWRLGRRPALDGLRGVAILLVVISHLSPAASTWRALGYAGVTVFFTLSGFLITSLLLEEHSHSGRIDLRRFYLRRARRLLPALVVFVAAVTLALAALGRWDWMTVGALTYTSNWICAAGQCNGSPLGHTWSLAIEEQFYLLWPIVLIVAARYGRRVVRDVLIALAGLTLVTPLMHGDSIYRIYYSFDTRAFPLVVGCLLAVMMAGGREGRSRPVLATLAVLGVVALARVPSQGGFEILFAPQFVAMVTAVAIFAAARGAGVGWLRHGWLRWLGLRSYGLYLWHDPVFAVLGHAVGPLWVAVLGVPVALVLTELSWRLVEQPFMRVRTPVSGGADEVDLFERHEVVAR